MPVPPAPPRGISAATPVPASVTCYHSLPRESGGEPSFELALLIGANSILSDGHCCRAATDFL